MSGEVASALSVRKTTSNYVDLYLQSTYVCFLTSLLVSISQLAWFTVCSVVVT